MASVLVTGGAGFIGSHIVDLLLKDGHTVNILDDLSSGKKENVPSGATLHIGDIKSAEVRALISEIAPDVVVHTAAQISVRVSMQDPTFDTQTNVVGLVNILQSFEGKKLPYFVMISTGGAIYGEQDYFPAKEDHPIRPESVYGLAKRVSELYLDLWRRQFGLEYAALRLSNVYGPRQNPHGEAGVIAIFCQKLLKGERPTINGTGAQTRDFIFVEDVAAAVRAVCEKRPSGIFNIGTGKEASVVELFSQIATSLGSAIEPIMGESKGGEQMRSCIDTGLAEKTFGWQPKVQLAEGVKRTTDWFSSQK